MFAFNVGSVNVTLNDIKDERVGT